MSIETDGNISLSVNQNNEIVATYNQDSYTINLVDRRPGKPFKSEALIHGIGAGSAVTGFKAYAADIDSDLNKGIIIRKNEHLPNPAYRIEDSVAWNPTVYEAYTFHLDTGEIDGLYYDNGNLVEINTALDRVDSATSNDGSKDHLYNILYWDAIENKESTFLNKFDHIINPIEIDDSEKTYFSIEDITIKEGDEGEIMITRSGNLSTTEVIDLTTTGITAILGQNITKGSPEEDAHGGAAYDLTWFPGEQYTSFVMRTFEDDRIEGNETFSVNLSGGDSSVVIVDGTGIVTIEDDDSAGTIFELKQTTNTRNLVNELLGNISSNSESNDPIDEKLLKIEASTWNNQIKINRISRAGNAGGLLRAKQSAAAADRSIDGRIGSVLDGGLGQDILHGLGGWDVIDGGGNDDLIHGGNGRDIIDGGVGADELHGDFGWNTFKSQEDGWGDLIAIKSDQHLRNWWYGKAGNSPTGAKADFIEGLDAIDEIKIVGAATSDLSFAENVTHRGATGIGIYAKGTLEAVFTGNNLSVSQIKSMTTGDASELAMTNQMWSYRSENVVP